MFFYRTLALCHKETLKHFKAEIAEVKEEFLSSDALAGATPAYQHKSLINTQDFDFNAFNVSAPVYKLPTHTAPALE